MHVAGRDGGDAQVTGKLVEPRVSSRIAPFVRPLQLDVEGPGKGTGHSLCRVRVAGREPVSGAARERDEAFGVAFDELARRLGRQEVALSARLARSRVRVGEDAAEIRVALAGLAEKR